MRSKSQEIFGQNLAVKQYVLNENEYDSQKILNIIRRYYELRSSAEVTTTQYGQISGGSSYIHGKDDIMCVLADIDRGVSVLSLRQMHVIKLLKMGYLIKEISGILGLRQVTVSFHIRQAGLRLAAYLNASSERER
ncbi:MAG: Sigma-70 region 4 type 2 [Massilibacillus sp.]|jgi:DNA-binding NarL/FixJ family response regulator|nr:Sigma-70 region 4 type 2 [Massilibacillus sp.]